MEKKQIVGYEVRTLDKMIGRLITSLFEKEGLTQMQGWIIGFLYEHSLEEMEDIFQKDLEANFHIARSTATCLLQSLEKRGYLRRESVHSDARLKRLILTEKGIGIHDTIVHTLDQVNALLKEGISPQKLDTFFEVIHMLKQNIQNNTLI